MKNKLIPLHHRQDGASAVEFLVVSMVLFVMGLGTLQAGLLYHSKTIVNYATFEAARVGATKHALIDPMKDELGTRLAPLFGGDGTIEKAAMAIAKSKAEMLLPVNLDGTIAPSTSVKILNPSLESFERWGRPSLEVLNKTAIPNSHLKHQAEGVGEGTAGMTLADANLLKIEVTHGVELTIPVVGKVITGFLSSLENLGNTDPVKLAYYQAGRIPVTSTATVRMQSEAWRDDTVIASAGVPFSNPTDPILGIAPSNPNPTGATGLNPSDPTAGGGCNSNGLSNLALNVLDTPGAFCPISPEIGGQSPVPTC